MQASAICIRALRSESMFHIYLQLLVIRKGVVAQLSLQMAAEIWACSYACQPPSGKVISRSTSRGLVASALQSTPLIRDQCGKLLQYCCTAMHDYINCFATL